MSSSPLLGAKGEARKRGSRATVTKVLLLVSAICSLELCVAFAILKWDGLTAMREWQWRTVLAPAGSAAAAFLVLFLLVDFATTAHGAESRNAEADLEMLALVPPRRISNFLAAASFRDAALGIGEAALMACAIFVALTPCKEGCNTPWEMVSIGLAVGYGTRVILRAIGAVWQFRHLRLMAAELAFDSVRLYELASADVYERRPYVWWPLLTAVLWAATVAFAGLGLAWIRDRACAVHCSTVFHSIESLLPGVAALEAFLLLSAGLLRYYRRKSGAETVETIISRVEADRRGKGARGTATWSPLGRAS